MSSNTQLLEPPTVHNEELETALDKKTEKEKRIDSLRKKQIDRLRETVTECQKEIESLQKKLMERQKEINNLRNKEISSSRKKQIESIVSELALRNPELNGIAFDIIKFLKEEGFVIASGIMMDDTTGLLIVDDNQYIPGTETHKLIIINSLLQEQSNFIQRRRFIVAHEYAHYLLHKNNSQQYAHRDASKKNTREEIEADFFARCLLMPEKIVVSLLNTELISSLPFEDKVSFVARTFNVTNAKAEQRLREDLDYDG